MQLQTQTDSQSWLGSDMADPRKKIEYFQVRYHKAFDLITALNSGIVENIWIHYCSILADLEQHLVSHNKLTIYFNLQMVSGTGLKYIFKIIKRLNQAFKEKKEVKILWSCKCENKEEMMDLGNELQKFCEFPFQLSYL